MADLDAELARFEAELAAVEQAVQPATADAPTQPPQAAPATHHTSSAPAAAPPPAAGPPATAPRPNPAASTGPASAPAAQQHHAQAPGPMYHQYNPPAGQAPPPMAPPPMYPPPPTYAVDPNQGYYMPPPPAMEPMYPAAPTMMGSTLSAAPVFTVPPVAIADEDTAYGTSQQQQEAAAFKAKDFKKKEGSKLVKRHAAGETWWDPTLSEWPENDFRIFVGDLGNEVNDDVLAKAFQHYPSFAKARVVRDKRSNKSKGFGFASFLESADFAKALREMDGKYIGNRPCKLKKSDWQDRNASTRSKWGNANKKQKK